MAHPAPDNAPPYSNIGFIGFTGFSRMAYDELLAERIRRTFDRRKVPFEEKRMIGGLRFLVDSKMSF